MIIKKYENNETVNSAISKNEPLIAVISFDGKNAFVAHMDEAVEHHILLNKIGVEQTNIEKYFRIIFDKDSCDWTFVCPNDYKGIKNKQRRIAEFYKDGFSTISDFLSEIGYLVAINIPKRYKRHFMVLEDKTTIE